MNHSSEEQQSAMLTEEITAVGHENVTAAHQSTFEITTDDYLTPSGDCILAIEADRAPASFSPEFVDACRQQSVPISITLIAGDHREQVQALGTPALTFESDRSAVVRTSDYVDDRTVAVAASKAAADFDDGFVEALSDGASLTVRFAVEPA